MSEITYYCPNCWREISPKVRVCPHCRTQLDERAQDSFVDKLLGALNHPIPARAAFAARVLGQQREARAVEPLLHALEIDDEGEVQEAAVRALGEIGDARAVPALDRILNDSRALVFVRVAAAEALGKIGTPESAAALRTAARAESHAVARAAREALRFLESVGLKQDGRPETQR